MTTKSILLVDDEKLLRLSLQVNLEGEGFEVCTADSAETALTELNNRRYDLLLTDYLMEGANGVELMQQARVLYPEIKVIVFSGFGDEYAADEILKFGADGFFCKPIDFDHLLEQIGKLLLITS